MGKHQQQQQQQQQTLRTRRGGGGSGAVYLPISAALLLVSAAGWYAGHRRIADARPGVAEAYHRRTLSSPFSFGHIGPHASSAAASGSDHPHPHPHALPKAKTGGEPPLLHIPRHAEGAVAPQPALPSDAALLSGLRSHGVILGDGGGAPAYRHGRFLTHPDAGRRAGAGEGGGGGEDAPRFVRVSTRPHVYYFPSVLSGAECDMMIRVVKGKLARSQVVPHRVGERSVSAVRTSQQTWLPRNESEAVARIYKRLEGVVGLNQTESMQVLRYQVAQKYEAHFDYFDPLMYGRQATNRAATFLLYLSDVEAGGETSFPRAGGLGVPHPSKHCSQGLRVAPRKGRHTKTLPLRTYLCYQGG